MGENSSKSFKMRENSSKIIQNGEKSFIMRENSSKSFKMRENSSKIIQNGEKSFIMRENSSKIVPNGGKSLKNPLKIVQK